MLCHRDYGQIDPPLIIPDHKISDGSTTKLTLESLFTMIGFAIESDTAIGIVGYR